jgi:hypothetical protein
VPFLRDRERDHEIEQEAALLLAEYAREHQPVLTPPLPIEDIGELHLKLTFELMNLEQRCGHRDIHGAIWVNQQRIAIDKQFAPNVVRLFCATMSPVQCGGWFHQRLCPT